MGWFGLGKRKRNVASTARQRRGFFFTGGRRYLTEAPYFLPKDDTEVNRLDFQHYMMRYAMQGNYAAPIGSPTSILDVATGTGRWAMEMAAEFPLANTVGVDIVTPPVDEAAVLGHGLDRRPDNYTFIQHNLLHGLPFADKSFQFVHQRLVVAAIPAARWQSVVNELYRVTAPGGWIELVEAIPATGGPAMNQLREWLIAVSSRRGVDTTITPHIGDFLRQAGAQNVTTRDLPLPLGRLGGHLGLMVETDYYSLHLGIRGIIIAQGIATEEAYDGAMNAARLEIARNRYIWPYFLAYGQRLF